MQTIYLDNNATTVIDPAVAQAMLECLNEQFVNPASQHQPGQRARRRLEQLRVEVAGALGAKNEGMEADRLIVTSGGTESNNLAISGLAHLPDGTKPPNARVLVSAIEHPSVIACAEYLATIGFDVDHIKVNRDGLIDLDNLREKLEQPTRLVSVMLANNETGVIQPVEEVVEICRSKEVLVHTDAVQAVGKFDIDFQQLGVDSLSFTAHKFHGPRGVGGLVLRHGLTPFPLVFGGFQQMGTRPGTEDVCLMTGLAAALKAAAADPDRADRTTKLRDFLEQRIIAGCDGTVALAINGGAVSRVPHTLNVSFLGIDRQALLMSADMHGLAISSGSACASGSSDPSPVLLAMGLDQETVEGSIRISLSAFTTLEEIELAADRIIKISKDMSPQKSD